MYKFPIDVSHLYEFFSRCFKDTVRTSPHPRVRGEISQPRLNGRRSYEQTDTVVRCGTAGEVRGMDRRGHLLQDNRGGRWYDSTLIK